MNALYFDPIIEFVVEGMHPESDKDAVDLLMRLPQYASKARWQSLFKFAIESAVNQSYDPVLYDFARWLLEPVRPDVLVGNAALMVKLAPARLRYECKATIACVLKYFGYRHEYKEKVLQAYPESADMWDKGQKIATCPRKFRPDSVLLSFFLEACSVKQAMHMYTFWMMTSAHQETLEVLRFLLERSELNGFLKNVLTLPHFLLSKAKIEQMLVLALYK